MRTYVLYHARCLDGFGAAWAAWKCLGSRVKYIPMTVGTRLPDFRPGSDIWMLDMARSAYELGRLQADGHQVRVIDHHKTWEKELGSIPGVLIDTRHAACVLAWKEFHPTLPLPELLSYIDDRDRWANEMDGSREVTSALATYPMNFRSWDKLDVDRLLEEGRVVVRGIDKLVERQVSQWRWGILAGWRVPVVNATAHISDVAHRLLDLDEDAPFSAVYHDLAGGLRKWSLRSHDDFDVGSLAQRFGGGGHAQAAGFTIRTNAPSADLPEVP